MIYKTIDLCAGIGGIRKGFELTGRFKNVLSAENDKFACITYKHLYNEDPTNDITTKEFKNKVKKVDYDILLAGFPCQAFSIAGNKEGFLDSTRGTLFFDIADIIKETNPKAFLLENVEGLIRHKKGQTFNVILLVLNELGYKIVGVEFDDLGQPVFNAKDLLRTSTDFGIPQKRSRTFIVGFKKEDIPENYVFPSLPKKRKEKLYNDLHDLLEEKVDSKFYLSDRMLTTLENHKTRHKKANSGFGYIVVNKQTPAVANTIMATGGSGKERNLIQQYVPEYEGKLVGKGNNINSSGIRYMTPVEWGKLQGFIDYAFIKDGKDHFSFPEEISNTQRYKQFGNSVTIPVIEEMAKYIYERMDDFYGNE